MVEGKIGKTSKRQKVIAGNAAILYLTNIFAQGVLQRILCGQCFFAFQSNALGFLINIEYAKVLIQLCWEIVIHLRH